MTGQRIFIPPLGTVIKLTQDWHFNLYNESRNDSIQHLLDLYPPFRDTTGSFHKYRPQAITQSWRDLTIAEREEVVNKSEWTNEPYEGRVQDFWSGDWHIPFVFREETLLKIDRIYIRQGQGAFNSVSFRTNCWMSNLGDPLFSKKYVKGKKVPSLRFWAKLDDVNNMIGEIVTPS